MALIKRPTNSNRCWVNKNLWDLLTGFPSCIDSFIRDMIDSYVTCLIQLCDMTESYRTWLVHVWHFPSCIGSDSEVSLERDHKKSPAKLHLAVEAALKHQITEIDVPDAFPNPILKGATLTWLIHMRHDWFISDMAHSFVKWHNCTEHDWFMRDMAHSYVTWLICMWHDWFRYATCLIHMGHDWFICDMSH